MERIIHLEAFGKRVAETRKSKNMSRVAFYNDLFPGNGSNEENIKRKMYSIEKAEQKSIDWDFFFAFCKKYDMSADYALGFQDAYSNHDLEFVCEYTGLEEKSVKTLHKWHEDSNNSADLSKMDEAIYGDAAYETWQRMTEKQKAIQYLKILNYLLKDSEGKTTRRSRKTERSSNVGILYSLYMLSMSNPVRAKATLLPCECIEDISPGDNRLQSYPEIVEFDAEKGVFFEDSSHIWYPLDLKTVIEKVAKENLMEDVDKLIEQVRSENKQRN